MSNVKLLSFKHFDDNVKLKIDNILSNIVIILFKIKNDLDCVNLTKIFKTVLVDNFKLYFFNLDDINERTLIINLFKKNNIYISNTPFLIVYIKNKPFIPDINLYKDITNPNIFIDKISFFINSKLNEINDHKENDNNNNNKNVVYKKHINPYNKPWSYLEKKIDD